MKNMIKAINREIKKTVKNPKRILSLLNPQAVKYYLRIIEADNLVENKWILSDNFVRRQYGSYNKYLDHQKSKLKHLSPAEYDKKYFQALSERLKKTGISLQNKNVLCLAARIGTEVRAFRDNGAFAVGIDLNPGKKNEYVLYGDFHNLKFFDDSIDVIFSNSLDHSFSLDKVLAEIKRVLKPGGSVIIEAVSGSLEGAKPGLYESTFWPTTNHLKNYIETKGLVLEYENPIDYPWKGKMLRFVKGSASSK